MTGPEARTQRVLRWNVPVNDRPHSVGGGPVALVASRETGMVEVWTVETVNSLLECAAPKRTVQVFGTGHRVPDGAEHMGSALDGPLVWHLFEVPGA